MKSFEGFLVRVLVFMFEVRFERFVTRVRNVFFLNVVGCW